MRRREKEGEGGKRREKEREGGRRREKQDKGGRNRMKEEGGGGREIGRRRVRKEKVEEEYEYNTVMK